MQIICKGKNFTEFWYLKKYIKRGKIWKYLVFACNPSHKQLKGKRQRQWVSVKINNSLDVNPLREHTQHTWPRPGLNSFDPRELGLVFGQISEPSYLAEDHLSKHSLPSCFYSLYISIFQFPIGIGDLPFPRPHAECERYSDSIIAPTRSLPSYPWLGVLSFMFSVSFISLWKCQLNNEKLWDLL